MTLDSMEDLRRELDQRDARVSGINRMGPRTNLWIAYVTTRATTASGAGESISNALAAAFHELDRMIRGAEVHLDAPRGPVP